MTKVSFKLNGKPIEIEVPSHLTLLEVLREHLDLTGTKEGCGKGECGACTVLMNNKPVCSCLVMIPQVEGAEIITIEGIGEPGNLHPIQKAFTENGAIQCGFCIPGFIMSAYALLMNNPTPTRDDIKNALSGNLCRCTGYNKIEEAVLNAAKEVS
ncbi:MAG: (2Fe-2S)-binding protein [Candidatus Eremiobacteraeota bacterium]|nr:(2Fe-2S)-binding protein [Candidatus Eremiobacteraeota bacterium]